MNITKIPLATFVLLINTPVFAYIGPGMGGGLIAAVLGIISAILIGIFGILYYPIKRSLQNKKKEK